MDFELTPEQLRLKQQVREFANAAIKPGATEVCDGVDNDCDASLDEGFDNDRDGYTTCAGDCNDNNSSIRPGAAETCDSVDNDCDGSIDEGVLRTYYRDYDTDSYGLATDVRTACSAPSGYTTRSGDCDDKMFSLNPNGYEICNGLDDDCDGLIDASDVFDITTDGLGTFNSACDSYDRVSAVDVPSLKLTYTIFGVSDVLQFYDTVLVGGHTPGARPSSSLGWPSTCSYYDKGYYWYDPGDAADTYSALLCFSKGTDPGGKDEVFLQVTYLGVNLKGVFDNESDSDGSSLDLVDYAAEESTTEREVWYVSDTANVSGIGYTASMELSGARVVIDTNN